MKNEMIFETHDRRIQEVEKSIIKISSAISAAEIWAEITKDGLRSIDERLECIGNKISKNTEYIELLFSDLDRRMKRRNKINKVFFAVFTSTTVGVVAFLGKFFWEVLTR